MIKKMPGKHAGFFIVLTILRVAFFAEHGLNAGIMSYFFAAGLAYGVYLSFYFFKYRETRFASACGAVLFLGGDLWFNELEVIRTLSLSKSVFGNANFLSIKGEYLDYALQGTGLLFGALPTLGAAVLGWMQSGADKLSDEVFESALWRGVKKAIGKMFAGIAVSVTVFFDGLAISRRADQNNAMSPLVKKPPVIDGQVTEASGKRKWKSLNADDIAFISANGRPQIMARFGISDGAAGNWKSAVLAGNKPWIDTKKNAKNAARIPVELPENAESAR